MFFSISITNITNSVSITNLLRKRFDNKQTTNLLSKIKNLSIKYEKIYINCQM